MNNIESMKYRAIIFDLDGTLLNTLDDLTASFNIACGEFGCPPSSPGEYQTLVGNGVRRVIESRFKQHRIPEKHIEQCIRIFRKTYRETGLSGTFPYPGIPELLDSLFESKIQLNVLSNKPHRETEQCIRQFFNIQLFEVIQGQKDDIPLKPDPTAAKQILNYCGIKGNMGLFIGDTSVDIETAHNAGMKAVGVTWGFRSETELKQCGADFIVSKPGDITVLCKK